MQVALIVISLAGFALLSFWKKEWALYLIVILLPTYQIRFQISFIPMTFLESLILILAIAHALQLWKNGGIKQAWQADIVTNKISTVFICLFLVAGLVSVFVSPVMIKGAGLFKAYILEGVIFYYLIIEIVDSPKRLRGLWFSAIFLVTELSIFGVYQYLSLSTLPKIWWGVDVAGRRITSLVNHPNSLAHLIGPILVIMAVSLLVNKKGEAIAPKKWLWPTVAIGGLALFLSFSRAGWLAALATAGVFVAIERPALRRWVAGGIVVTIIIILILPISRSIIVPLLYGNDPSQQNRFILWDAALDMIKKAPLTGVGLAGFHEIYKNYPLGPDQVVQNYPHNFFLNFWVETGLLGLASIIGLLTNFYRKVVNLHKQGWVQALVVAAGMTTILLHGQVDVPFFKNDLALLFWMLLALPQLNFLSSSALNKNSA